MNDKKGTYEVDTCSAAELSQDELAATLALIQSGEAVDPAFVEQELPQASKVAIIRMEKRIVGVGAIKRIRPYAATVARRSGWDFSEDTPELGYVAVCVDHRGNGLSRKIVAALISGHERLFATTSNALMKATLQKSGFVRKGQDWTGASGNILSLWIRG